jgi:hypothetical protein
MASMAVFLWVAPSIPLSMAHPAHYCLGKASMLVVGSISSKLCRRFFACPSIDSLDSLEVQNKSGSPPEFLGFVDFS